MNTSNAPTSKLAIAALVCAVLFCIPLLPMVGVALGVVALLQINKSQGAQGGQVLAIVAICVGGLMSVANIGVVAAIAIPNFIRYQLRAKTSEAKLNLSQIRSLQEAYFVNHGVYISTQAEGSGQDKVAWTGLPCPDTCPQDPGTCTFACLGFAPGPAYFRYACNAIGNAYTCAASANLDMNADFGAWVVGNSGPDGPAPTPDLKGAENCPEPTDQVTECRPGIY